MTDLSDSEQKFLEKHFKAGEYVTLTILVKNAEFTRLMDILKGANLNLAILPQTQAKIDFADDTKRGTEQ